MGWYWPVCVAAVVCAAYASTGLAAEEAGYPRENIYDATVQQGEVLVNVTVASHRWPDCTTLESAIQDIFRLEGAQEKRDEDKALALWKWFRILVSATGGAYAYEQASPNRPVTDPHKIFTVYGHHQCDGMSWAMVPLWRAAGYIAFDQCHWGHTIASLRYKDDDGQYRFHDLDPQGRFYYWDEQNKRVGTWTNPILRAKVHRHLMTPQHIHCLRTSLRLGEVIERKWDNEGRIVASGKDKLDAEKTDYYKYEPGKRKGVYASAGEEVQTYLPGTSIRDLMPEKGRNLVCLMIDGQPGSELHLVEAGKPGEIIYRLAPPYVVADAWLEATVMKRNAADICRLLLSTDGKNWEPAFVMEKTGTENIRVNIGKDAWLKKQPNAYTAYDVLVKVELQGAAVVRDLKMTAVRMLNKRTLPNLRPGENVLRVTADNKLPEGVALELVVNYRVDGKDQSVRQCIGTFPHYFRIDVPRVAERVLKNYDQDFNNGALQMKSIRLQFTGAGATGLSASLDPADGEKKFKESSPHPADMTDRKICKAPETDVRQTNGFFPQAAPGRVDDEAKMKELVGLLNGGSAKTVNKELGEQWMAAEDLGDYPKAVDALLAALPRADIDLTLFICKALARMPDKKAIGPLLDKWKRGPDQAPGTRYIPDVLAAIGDRSVVPQLVAPLRKCRFDYRFHIAYALGVLGGPEAETALKDLAENDPFPANRDFAKEMLEKLRSSGKSNERGGG